MTAVGVVRGVDKRARQWLGGEVRDSADGSHPSASCHDLIMASTPLRLASGSLRVWSGVSAWIPKQQWNKSDDGGGGEREWINGGAGGEARS